MEKANGLLKKLDHLVLTTADVARCLDFYQRLGFTPDRTGGRVQLLAGDFKINVHTLGAELLPHAAQVQPGSADLCFQLTIPLDDYCTLLEQQGVTVELGPVLRTGVYGPMQSVYLRDPDGNLLEFSSYAE